MSATIDYQPLAPETIADPFAVFRELRSAGPVHWHEQLHAWVVTTHAECQEVLRNSTDFARDPRRVGRDMPEGRRNIQTQDPPEQAELRRLVMRALHNQDIAGVTKAAASALRIELLERAGAGPFDLMTLAAPAAMNIINAIVGSVERDARSYHSTFVGLTRAMDSGLDGSRLEAGRAAGAALSESVTTWFSAPTERGMLAELQQTARAMGDSAHYVYNTVGGVFNAGFSTLYASTGSVVHLLLHRPDVLRGSAHADLGTTAHELLRYLSPAQATSRYVVNDTDLAGTFLRAGSTVVTLIASANRDAAVFESADELVLDRNPNPHLAFAWGPHVCLGAQLATAWVGELVTLMRHLAPRLSLAGDAEYMDSATLRNLTVLPVTVA